jgi:hypothetical protein
MERICVYCENHIEETLFEMYGPYGGDKWRSKRCGGTQFRVFKRQTARSVDILMALSHLAACSDRNKQLSGNAKAHTGNTSADSPVS